MTLTPLKRRGFAGTVDVVVVGAGHSGLAMSHALAARSIDHVVLERGEVASSWKHERWDSLRLLTPNWLSRLPGYAYSGDNPDGYMTMPEVVDFISGYAQHIGAPVRTGVTVESVTATNGGYVVATDAGTWRCRAVVAANGANGTPIVPAAVQGLPPSVRVLTAKDYRNPAELDDGPVLVVGASATGVQLADEIRRSGRTVTLAVGEHIRMPRVYRSVDIQWWLKSLGILDERFDEVDDIVRARRVPSPQLVGSPDRATLDLNALTERGVELVGRLAAADGAKLYFNGALANHCAMADLKVNRLLERADEWARKTGVATGLPEPERPAPTRVPESPRLTAKAGEGGFATIVLATGFKPDYSWLQLPVFRPNGQLRHDGGVVSAPGVYVLGLTFMRRRKSSFIHGAEDDVRDLSEHLASYLCGSEQLAVAG